MKRLLALILFAVLSVVLATDSYSQGSRPKDKPDTSSGKTFGSGSKPDTSTKTDKTFGSGSKSDTSAKSDKTFGSGFKADKSSTDKPADKSKTFGSGDKSKATDTKKTFGSGDSKKTDHVTPPTTGPPKDVGSKPKGTFDTKAAASQKKEESKAAFMKGKAPAPTYVDPRGKTVTIDEKDVRIANLRSQLSEEKWRNRELRERNFYATYYSRPVVVYSDPYSSFFWYWLLDRSIEEQALWAYHHRRTAFYPDGMDSARYNDLLARNAELAARVRALEASGVRQNPAYQPAGIPDTDLMYNSSYVDAAYNPTHAPQTQHTHHDESDGSALHVLLYIFLALAIIAIVVWLVFVKKW